MTLNTYRAHRKALTAVFSENIRSISKSLMMYPIRRVLSQPWSIWSPWLPLAVLGLLASTSTTVSFAASWPVHAGSDFLGIWVSECTTPNNAADPESELTSFGRQSITMLRSLWRNLKPLTPDVPDSSHAKLSNTFLCHDSTFYPKILALLHISLSIPILTLSKL